MKQTLQADLLPARYQILPVQQAKAPIKQLKKGVQVGELFGHGLTVILKR